MRDIGIYLDDEKIGVVGNGEIKEFTIEPGEYLLLTKIDWCGIELLKINLTENETKRVEVSRFKLGKFMIPIALIVSIIYFDFGEELNLDPRVFLSLFLPLGLYLFYHMTLGRDKYLILQEK